MSSTQMKQSWSILAFKKFMLYMIELSAFMMFDYTLSVEMDSVPIEHNLAHSRSFRIREKAQQQQAPERHCFKRNRRSKFRAFLLQPITLYARIFILSIAICLEIVILRSNSMKVSYWLGDFHYSGAFSRPIMCLALVADIYSLSLHLIRHGMPQFEKQILRWVLDDVKCYVGSVGSLRNQDADKPIYKLLSSNDARCRELCWLFISYLGTITFTTVASFVSALVISSINNLPLPLHGALIRSLLSVECCSFSTFHAGTCGIVTRELGARTKAVRDQLERLIFTQDRCNSATTTTTTTTTKYVTSNDSLIMPDYHDWAFYEMHRLGIALALVIKDVSRSNEYWKLGFFIHIVFHMTIAVIATYSAINVNDPFQLMFCVTTAIASWFYIAVLWFDGFRANTEIAQFRQLILRNQHRIDISYRYVSFKIYSTISSSDVGYSVLEFFQITRRSALILFGWFGSAIILILTYFEQGGAKKFLFTSKVNDFN
ncbi:hypothetical protein GZH46_02006, partial [Fragariocoptes setiger]